MCVSVFLSFSFILSFFLYHLSLLSLYVIPQCSLFSMFLSLRVTVSISAMSPYPVSSSPSSSFSLPFYYLSADNDSTLTTSVTRGSNGFRETDETFSVSLSIQLYNSRRVSGKANVHSVFPLSLSLSLLLFFFPSLF